MKKLSPVLALVFSAGIASVFVFTPISKKIVSFSLSFFPVREPPVPLTLVSVDDDSLENLVSEPLDSEKSEKLNSFFKSLGAKASFGFSDFLEENLVQNIDPLIEKTERISEKEKSLFGLKIVIPGKNNSVVDTKSPEIKSKLILSGIFSPDSKNLPEKPLFFAEKFPSSYEHALHLVARIGESYYAPAFFADLVQNLSDSPASPKILVTDSAISVTGISEIPEKSEKIVRIPRLPDGSVLLKFPAKSWKDFKNVSFSEIYELFLLEEKLNAYIAALNPESEENSEILSENIASSPSDESVHSDFDSPAARHSEPKAKNLSAELNSKLPPEYKKIFSEIEGKKAELSEKLRGSLCFFALTSASRTDFIKSPFEKSFPKSLYPYVLANMILSEDFFPMSFYRAIVWGSAFFAFLLTLLVFLLIFHTKKISERHSSILNCFQQPIPKSDLKEILSLPSDFALNAHKNEISVLASSIRNFEDFSSVLNENQLIFFINYYLEKISETILENGGTVESYRNDEVISLFGAPVHSENHVSASAKVAFALKNVDRKINEGIERYPLYPKPDGMSDDLYTTFFILNQNNRKISTKIGIYTAEIVTACIGGKRQKSYRITDDSWKTALSIKNVSQKFGTSGVLINEKTAELLKDDYIIRKLSVQNQNQENSPILSEILSDLNFDDDKLWNYANYWNQAVDLLEKGEKEKALAVFKKLSEGRPNDRVAKYFIKSINGIE